MYAATLASFDGTALDLGGLDPRDRYWHRQVAARGWTPAHGTQVCPGCLADSGTWKTAWRLLLVNACTDHGVMLTARCPACRRPFRDQRHSHLRTVGAATVCGNPLGQGPVKQCQHDLITLTGSSPPPRVLATQARMNSALAGEVVTVLGRPAKPTAYVTDLRHLTTLLLHLAGQPGADTLAPWVSDLAAAAADGTAARGACPTTSTPPARTECVCRSTCSLSLKSSPTRSTLSTWPAPLPPAKRPSDSSPPVSLARLHLDISSWAAAAEALVMPGRMGVRCARACSATMLVTADEWKARVWRAIEEIPRELQHLGGQDPPPPRGGAAGSTNWPDATGLAPDTAPTTSA